MPIAPDEAGRLNSDENGLLPGVHGERLRFFTPEGALIPAPAEALEAEKQEKAQALHDKEQALLDKEQALQVNEHLAAKLRELGVDPSKLSE